MNRVIPRSQESGIHSGGKSGARLIVRNIHFDLYFKQELFEIHRSLTALGSQKQEVIRSCVDYKGTSEREVIPT